MAPAACGRPGRRVPRPGLGVRSGRGRNAGNLPGHSQDLRDDPAAVGDRPGPAVQGKTKHGSLRTPLHFEQRGYVIC